MVIQSGQGHEKKERMKAVHMFLHPPQSEIIQIKQKEPGRNGCEQRAAEDTDRKRRGGGGEARSRLSAARLSLGCGSEGTDMDLFLWHWIVSAALAASC
ncbi:hypothetical protein SRHO_G00007430 [Serrasalmus rhombeus]